VCAAAVELEEWEKPLVEVQADRAKIEREREAVSCADERNLVCVIDRRLLFIAREGLCADARYEYRLSGTAHTGQQIVCALEDSIAGPRWQCDEAHLKSLMNTIRQHLDQSDLGLGSQHDIERIFDHPTTPRRGQQSQQHSWDDPVVDFVASLNTPEARQTWGLERTERPGNVVNRLELVFQSDVPPARRTEVLQKLGHQFVMALFEWRRLLTATVVERDELGREVSRSVVTIQGRSVITPGTVPHSERTSR